MIKAIFLDFYGTAVYGDCAVFREITLHINKTRECTRTDQFHPSDDSNEIGLFCGREFQSLCIRSFGQTFQTQRELAKFSLRKTIEYFCSSADSEQLSNLLFQYWVNPSIFEETKDFFNRRILPVYIVSNIDTEDIKQALAFHGLKPAGVFTSEMARSYKPKTEIFALALRTAGLGPEEVIHIGDSLSSDVEGAQQVGILPIWLNRNGKTASAAVRYSAPDLTKTLDLIGMLRNGGNLFHTNTRNYCE